MYQWLIYALHDETGAVFYVGITNNLRRRRNEHRKKLQRFFTMSILEKGMGMDEGAYAEDKWIEHYRSTGHALINKTVTSGCGIQIHSQATRQLISSLHKGRVVTPETRKRLSEATRGKPKDWTPEGWESAGRTRFQKGHSWYGDSEERKAALIEVRKRMWDDIPLEERSRRATERNLTAWANRSPDERSAIAKKMAATARANHTPEQLSNIAARNGAKASADPETRARITEGAKNWWKNMTPEQKQEYVTRRAKAIKEAKLRKALNNEPK